MLCCHFLAAGPFSLTLPSLQGQKLPENRLSGRFVTSPSPTLQTDISNPQAVADVCNCNLSSLKLHYAVLILVLLGQIVLYCYPSGFFNIIYNLYMYKYDNKPRLFSSASWIPVMSALNYVLAFHTFRETLYFIWITILEITLWYICSGLVIQLYWMHFIPEYHSEFYWPIFRPVSTSVKCDCLYWKIYNWLLYLDSKLQ